MLLACYLGGPHASPLPQSALLQTHVVVSRMKRSSNCCTEFHPPHTYRVSFTTTAYARSARGKPIVIIVMQGKCCCHEKIVRNIGVAAIPCPLRYTWYIVNYCKGDTTPRGTHQTGSTIWFGNFSGDLNERQAVHGNCCVR